MQKLYWHGLATAVIAFGGLAGLLLLARFGYYSDVMMVIFFAGSVGAALNNYYRLASLQSSPGAQRSAEDNGLVVVQMYVSLFVGGILAFAVYGLFLGGFIQGSLFPSFEKTKEPYKDLTSVLLTVSPATNLDTAKALIWALIAGFSERLVPNIIDGLVKKAGGSSGT